MGIIFLLFGGGCLLVISIMIFFNLKLASKKTTPMIIEKETHDISVRTFSHRFFMNRIKFDGEFVIYEIDELNNILPKFRFREGNKSIDNLYELNNIRNYAR